MGDHVGKRAQPRPAVIKKEVLAEVQNQPHAGDDLALFDEVLDHAGDGEDVPDDDGGPEPGQELGDVGDGLVAGHGQVDVWHLEVVEGEGHAEEAGVHAADVAEVGDAVAGADAGGVGAQGHGQVLVHLLDLVVGGVDDLWLRGGPAGPEDDAVVEEGVGVDAVLLGRLPVVGQVCHRNLFRAVEVLRELLPQLSEEW